MKSAFASLKFKRFCRSPAVQLLVTLMTLYASDARAAGEPSAGELTLRQAFAQNAKKNSGVLSHASAIILQPLADLRDLPRARFPIAGHDVRPVSVFTPDQFERLNTAIVAQKQIIFKDIKEEGHLGGCFARSEEIARVMELNGMMVSKLFVFPAGGKGGFIHIRDPQTGEIINWGYHVLPAVLVKVKERLEIYVIDPALSRAPLSLEHMISLMWSDGEGGKFDLVAGDRSTYVPDDLKVSNPFHHVNRLNQADSLNVLEVQRRREEMKN